MIKKDIQELPKITQDFEYKENIIEEAEIKANRFNLVFTAIMIILSFLVVLFCAFGIFSLNIIFTVIAMLISITLFSSPLFVYLIHDKILKKDTILKWEKFKYVIYVPDYFGLLLIDIMFSYHAVILIVIPPLMAAQYKFIRRDWRLIFITTVISIPIVIYGSFLFGLMDRNLLKNMLTDEEAETFANRISVLGLKRIYEIFVHYVIPRILGILAIDFLVSAIVKRNKEMLEKQVELSEMVRKESEKNSELQQVVIEELASVIESRDLSTGEHIKRTKEYVSILCNELKKDEKYRDILTPSTIRYIINAAPLHDIGKITVSDLILLKPGKLTKEEYEKMKEHSSMGGKMIKEFFNHFDNDDFVKNAYEIAMYHHEKWDGSGYPNGLKGEEIPLSARIMAISDVFDALVSKRVYKDAIPKEEAFNIILEEAGKHFDPSIIQALINSKDEFMRIVENE